MIGHGPSWSSTSLYDLLARRVSAPEIWASVIIELAGKAPLLAPFLFRTVEARREGWEYLLSQCLSIGPYADLAVSLVLRMSEPPSGLLSQALKEAPRFIETINSLCLWKVIDIATLKELLRHSSREVAVAAAAGEWASEPRGIVRKEVLDEWRAAVISASPFDVKEATSLQYWMGEMLKANPDLNGKGASVPWGPTHLSN